jgi:hypothetical protein
MPEGIGPGSGVLQETVKLLFSDFDWAIVIFDNILILATDYQDGYKKFEIFLDRCIKHNVVLKFSKSWLGFQEVKFFGYVCKHKSYELTEDRKLAISSIPFPETGNRATKLRSMLGSGVFFSPFIKNYTEHCQHLTDMTKEGFNWNDEKNWKYNYRSEFEDYKSALQKACAIYYPDYTLTWIIRVDASELGIGGVLLQIFDGQEQIIALVSKKFSERASEWATIEQEGYAIYYTVKKLAYYLMGKEFIVETDHNNLLWMEASEVGKIIRWRILLQSFVFKIRHIPGKTNVLPDTLSRLFMMYNIYNPFTDNEEELQHQLNGIFETEVEEEAESIEQMMTQESMLAQIHNYKEGHWGEHETWKRLNKEFPGHGIAYRKVAEFVAMCNTCQKLRIQFSASLKPVIRHLKPPSSRTAIGIDAVEITPHGKNGMTHINVVCNLFAKLVYLDPVNGCTAKNLTTTVWKYWANFGHTDMIVSDLGPDLNSDLFAQLVELMGMKHKFSITDKHVNGCERQIQYGVLILKTTKSRRL